MIGAVRMIQRNALVYRKTWRGSLFSSFLQPTLFLVAMGIGLGKFVNAGDTSLLAGLDFLHFLAPGMLAAACMQTASFESAFPITGKMMWRRNYEAINATPMRVFDVVLGELGWVGIRLCTVSVAFLTIMAAFGIPESPLALLAIPAAVLTGLAFSAPIMAYAATRKHGGQFNSLFRFVITPLFLFSGVFFPISRLPGPLQTFAWFTPLFHGVSLVRGLTLNTIESPAWMIHVGYLTTMLVVGILVAVKTFGWKLKA
jgi:lipooligosaccharide transport system permease protein